MTRPKPRLPESPKDVFDDQIVMAFQRTTVEQRELIARAFEAGQVVESWGEFCKLGVLPVAIIVASLVDADSPLVFTGRMKLKKPTMLELALLVSKLPQFSTISHSSVDNSPKSVDKAVDNLLMGVDNYKVPVDKLSILFHPAEKLSTSLWTTGDSINSFTPLYQQSYTHKF